MRNATTLAAVYKLLLLAWSVSEVLLFVFLRTRSNQATSHDRGSLLILWLTFPVSFTTGIWFGATHVHDIFDESNRVLQLSIALFLTGILIRWIAILTLGKSFSVNVAIPQSHRIRQTGIFHFVRHPSYAGLLLIVIAIGLRTRNWTAFAFIMVPIAAALLYRIHVEEIALRKAFPRDYETYSKTTKGLIPWIY